MLLKPRRMMLIFAGIFTLLVLPWPGLATAYCTGFSAFWTMVLQLSHDATALGFELHPEAAGDDLFFHQWSVAAFAEKNGAQRKVNSMNVRRTSYIQCAVYLALVIAVSGTVKGRSAWLNAGSGLLILQLLPAMMMVILLQQAGAPPLSRTAETVVIATYRSLVNPPGMAYALPAFVWLLLHRKILWRRTAES